MALIKCEECGKEISAKAKNCVHCGCSILNENSSSVDNNKDSKEIVVKQSINEFFDKNTRSLNVEFDAVVSNKSKESTINTIYIKELDKNVEVSVPNNIKANEKIWKKIDDDSKCDLIIFTVKTVSKDLSIKSVATEKRSKKKEKENKTINDVIKNYNPNFLVRFFDGPGVMEIINLLLAFSIIFYFRMGYIEIPIIFVIVVIPLIIIRMIYPFLKLIKYIKKNHIDDAIKNDPDYLNIAISTFNLLPSKRMLWYIKKINIDAGLEIEKQIRNK